MSEDAIDLKEFLERVQDDKDLLVELLDIYMEDFKEKRKALGEAAQTKNLDQIKNVAHSLKGSSGNISAKRMHMACLQIEQLAKAGDVNAITQSLSHVDQIFAAIQSNTEKIKKDFKG